MISPDQCRAARAILKLSAADLAATAKIGIATVKRFESGQPIQPATLEAIRAALIDAGVELIQPGERSSKGGEGVRLSVKRRDGAG